jgi:hypothetical protein
MPSPRSPKGHLWIVITERTADHEAVCINVTDELNIRDKTTQLVPGDHSFITKNSVIYYQSAKVVRLDLAEDAIQNRTWGPMCKTHQPCSAELMNRIRAGLFASRYTTKAIKARCKAEWEAKRAK